MDKEEYSSRYRARLIERGLTPEEAEADVEAGMTDPNFFDGECDILAVFIEPENRVVLLEAKDICSKHSIAIKKKVIPSTAAK